MSGMITSIAARSKPEPRYPYGRIPCTRCGILAYAKKGTPTFCRDCLSYADSYRMRTR